MTITLCELFLVAAPLSIITGLSLRKIIPWAQRRYYNQMIEKSLLSQRMTRTPRWMKPTAFIGSLAALILITLMNVQVVSCHKKDILTQLIKSPEQPKIASNCPCGK